MDGEDDRWLGPGEAARRLGVTAKALRVYEREGLVKPARTNAGWRLYGPGHIARLHLVVVMRDLGVPLKAVGALLRHKPPSLAEVLTVQQGALEEKRRRLDRAISLLTAARRNLASGQDISLDDLTNLGRETVMNTDPETIDAEKRFAALIESRADAAVVAAIKDQSRGHLRAIGKSREDMRTEMHIFLAEARAQMAAGDPDAEPARAAVRRWLALVGGLQRPAEPDRAALKAAVNEATAEAFADPDLAAKLPFDAPLLDFIRKVVAGLRASGERVDIA